MVISNMNYDEKESCIFLNDSKFKVYGHDDEPFEVHISKTLLIFEELLDKPIIYQFYEKFFNNKIINFSFEKFLNLIFLSIKFHDVGKLSFKFQLNKLNQSNDLSYKNLKPQKDVLNDYGLLGLVPKFESNHSFIGALIFILKFCSEIEKNELFGLILAYSILGHHTNLKDIIINDTIFSNELSENQLITLKFISIFHSLRHQSQNYFQNVANLGSKLLKDDSKKFGSFISFFYMYIYSLLVVSDIFATDEYELSLEDFKLQLNEFNFNNRITPNLKNKMNKSFTSKSYNQNLDSINYEPISLDDVVDINDLRKEMLLESSNKLLNSYELSNVFFLNMPTGAGKTNTSMKLALDLINNTSADRVVYAMPFINIIEQNYDVICDSFGLSEDEGEIRKIYSGSETIFSDKSDEFKYDILLNDDFFNYPVVCTTFVSLFNTVIKNNKKSKYRLVSLANSVIILDEIQSLPLKNWISLYYIINELALNYNIYFIIMSATLPEFDMLKLDPNSKLKYSNVSLIENPHQYFNHKLFNRTEIKNDVKEFKLSAYEYEEAIDYLLEIIKENFNQNYNKGLMVFNTIKSSKRVFDYLSEYADEYGFEIDLLNSSLMPSSKKEIISKVNNFKSDEFTDKKYLLISTQSVEAGVDVSFDFVVRDFAIIDSIEQVRGRCNRSGELNKRFNDLDKKGNVYLVNFDDGNHSFYEYIYDKEEQKTRIECTKCLVYDSLNYSYENIQEYYSNVSSRINQLNNGKKDDFRYNEWDNIDYLNKTEYSKIKNKDTGIHIINNDQKQFSIFISTDLNVMSNNLEKQFNRLYDCSIFELDETELIKFYDENKNNFIFSANEILFIKSKGQDLYEDNKIVANSLLNYYELLFNQNKSDFNYYKLIRKEFASILYKFIINISVNSYEEIYSEIEDLQSLGFFKILPKEKIGEESDSFYSLKRGFNFKPNNLNMEIL